MPPAALYRFEVWDQIAGANIQATRFATLEAIGRVRGVPLDSTVRVIDSGDLVGDGFFPKDGVWLVKILDIVSRVVNENRRVSVPLGEYVMRERSTESFWLTNDDLLPVGFELTLPEVATYLQGKMRIVAGNWP